MEKYNDNKYNDLLYVNCYAKKNVMCNSISKIKNGMCDKCYKDINRNLTKQELIKNFISIKQQIIDKIKIMLINCDNTIGKENKAKEVLHIFDLIYHNIYFTILHIKFIKIFIKKIIELVKIDISIINNVVDKQLNVNETYIDVLDFMININDYYKDKIDLIIDDDNFLFEYNNFMKELYNSICIKYNNTQSVNKINIQTEKQENIKNQQNTKQEDYNICDNQIYNSLKEIQIDV
jgi:hypothetical protein